MPHDQPPFDPSADPEVNAARRRFGALFALFGGGAVAASCGAEEGPIADLPSTRRVAQALSIDSAAIGRLDTVDELLGAPGTAGNTNSVGMSTFKLVLVNNYHSDAPGGGGLFYWIGSAGPTTLAGGLDDGLNIVPYTGTGSTRTTSGYWRRIYQGPLNVKDFGARGTGSGDDTQAIQNAVATASHFPYVSGGAAEIYFPPGVYIVKQSIQITSGRIHLRGAGPMASVILIPVC